MKKHIYLIGFMGTGKSTVSRNLAEITGYLEWDTDYEISEKENLSIPKIFEKYGESGFRQLETQTLREILLREPSIISCGGGMVLAEENIELMKKSGIVILLLATPETILSRVKNGKERPVLNGHMNVEYIEELMKRREAYYEAAQDQKVVTDGKQPQEIAVEIKRILDTEKICFDFLEKV